MEMLNTDFNTKYRLRTKKLAIAVAKLIKAVQQDLVNSVLLKQLLRCATSVAANFRAVCQSRSTKERFAKLSIVIEELDETTFWMEMLIDANIIGANGETEFISQESLELLKVFSSYRKKMKVALSSNS